MLAQSNALSMLATVTGAPAISPVMQSNASSPLVYTHMTVLCGASPCAR